MPVPVHVFSIPPESKHLADVPGTHFDATIYELEDGTVGAYVEVDATATDQELSAEQMNTKIKDAAAPRAVDFYVKRRRDSR